MPPGITLMAMKFAGKETAATAQGAARESPFFSEAPESAARSSTERFCSDRRFISGNANKAMGFAGEVEKMLRSPEFEELLRKVTRIARDYGNTPKKALSKEDGELLMNFRVNFNAILNDSELRKVLVKCAEGSRIKELARHINSEEAVKAGFDRVTPMVHAEEKFHKTVRALWELRSFF